MPWSAVSLFICLLLPLSSSAPLSSHSDSSSDEERQLPVVFPVVGVASPQAPPTLSKAPPGVVVQVEDTKRNITLSFAIFIIPEEEEGSGTDGRGGSDENSSSRESDDITDDVSSEETRNQNIQPASSLPPSENLSSEEMMSDQPMFTSSDEQTDDFNNTAQSLSDDSDYFIDTLTESNVSQKLGVSDEFDDFNNSTESEEGYSQAAVTVPDDSDDKNNTRSDDFTHREETAIDDSDDFNNSTETNNQPVRIIFDYFHDKNTISDEPIMSLSDDFSNSSSTEVTELNQNQQLVPLNPYNQTTMNSQHQISDMNKVDKLVLNPVVQEITSSSSEKTSSINQDKVGSSSGHINRDAGLGSRLQEMFHSIPEVVDLLSGNHGAVNLRGSHHKDPGSIPSSLPGGQKLLNSSESEENSELFSIVSFNPKHQDGLGSDPDSDETIKVSDGIQQGTGSRDSKKTVSKPKTSSISDLFSLDSDSKEVEGTSDKSSQVNKTDGLNSVGPGLDPAPMILSMPKNTVSQRNSKKSPRSHLQVNVYINSDSSEESLDSVGPQQEAGSGQGLSGLSSPELSSSSEESQDSVGPQQEAGSGLSSPELSSSSEESQDSVGPQQEAGSGQGLSGLSSPEVSSSSEEVVLALVSSSSPPPASSPVASQSDELDLSDSVTEPDPPGLDSETTELHPDPIPTSDSSLSPGFISNPGFGTNFSSEVSQSESDESLTTETPTDANADAATVEDRADAASLAASSGDSMDVKLDDDVKDTEADLSLAAATYSSSGINEAPTTTSAYSASHTSMHVSSKTNTDANTDELSVEKDEASTEATAVSTKPPATIEYMTTPVNLRASTDAIANVKKEQAAADVSTEANQDASSPGPKKPASSEENMAFPLPPPPLPPPPPPRRKKPFRFGSFGPISYSYGNQPVVRETVAEERGASSNTYTRREFAVRCQNKTSDPLRILFNTQYNVDRQRHPQVVSHHANRKQLRVSVAAVANPAESSSEETKK